LGGLVARNGEKIMEEYDEFEKWWNETGKDYGYNKQAVYLGWRWAWIIAQDESRPTPLAADGRWKCKNCGKIHAASYKNCVGCGNARR